MVDNTSLADDTQKPKKKRFQLLGWIFLLLLIPSCIFIGIWVSPMFYPPKPIAEKKMDLGEIQMESDSLYRALQAELVFYKSQSDSLYPEIDAREEELDKQYIRLQNLISQAKQDKSSNREIEQKMQEMRVELSRLRQFVDDQTLDLAEMRRENNKLLVEKKELTEKYEMEKTDKERLADENQKLEDQKDELAQKVDRASVLQIVNVSAVGAKLSSKGIDKEADIAKKTEFIKICFDVVRNDVARAGINKFYITITDPSGWPIFSESRGSGKIANVERGTEEYFTTMKSFNYNPDFKELCLTWSQDPQKPFTKGVYQIDVYNQGYKVGSTSLTLK